VPRRIRSTRPSHQIVPTYGPAERAGSRTKNALLAKLSERIKRIVLPFGITAIDRTLPGGGLARGALHVGQAVRERALPNAAVTRWRIAALPSRPMRDGWQQSGSPRIWFSVWRGKGWERGGSTSAFTVSRRRARPFPQIRPLPKRHRSRAPDGDGA
jgi:hypothetical protein